ncbi:hypothetical protein CTheo_9029 [Ceratobasidium theobromae]|uniref:ATP-binding protein n=1 Tax=Ceratobasidium theobromae TaxID=1582974 RepID=A0A5N5Q6R7_9AGAM|nr:hypothetical protein CTheo_9029 [Ceratobasidium theobromae]
MKYLGSAVDGLYNYLERNNELANDFSGDQSSDQYYGKFCSIVQSSGTGKSRTMIELRTKGVIVLYMNIRGREEVDTFPTRDDLIANILTDFPKTLDLEEYEDECRALFTAIFRVLRSTFEEYLPLGGSQELIDHWNKNMCSLGSTEREAWFQKLSDQQRIARIEISKERAMRASKAKVDQVGTRRGILGAAFLAWIDFAIQKLGYDPRSHAPHLVIELDEAHTLSQRQMDLYRPADLLCRVISDYSQCDYPIWVLFASTTSRVADFSAPSAIYNSLRVSSGGQLLFPPYIHLDWDQHARIIDEVKPGEVSKLDYLARLGRPLWYSVMESRSSSPLDDLFRLACKKLCDAKFYAPVQKNQALAVWDARFCIDICPGHVDFNEQGLANDSLPIRAIPSACCS